MKGRSPYQFIVSAHRYNNKVDVDGMELVVNTEISEKDFRYTNRVGTVLATPINYNTPIHKGDKIIVHHNVFRRFYDVRGNEDEATGFLEDNTFLVNYDEIFAYKQQDTWRAMDGYVFVSPLPADSLWTTTGETALKGVMEHPNEELEFLRDHVVGFTPESEYEFNIDGERLYRVYANQVTIDYGSKEKKKENNTLQPEGVG